LAPEDDSGGDFDWASVAVMILGTYGVLSGLAASSGVEVPDSALAGGLVGIGVSTIAFATFYFGASSASEHRTGALLSVGYLVALFTWVGTPWATNASVEVLALHLCYVASPAILVRIALSVREAVSQSATTSSGRE